LQRSYLDILKAELLPKESGGGPGGGPPFITGDFGGGSTDFRAVARVALRRLQGQVVSASNRSPDPITAAHLLDCEREIDAMLAHKK
jgi:hypothetical protein